MAFTILTLQIDDILSADFIPDAFTKVNSNFLELQSNFEDLVNNFQIDLANKKIGSDDPISLLRTNNAIIKAGTLIYQTSVGTQVGSLTLNASNESVFNADHLVIDKDMSITDITASGTTSLAALSASGPIAFTGKVTMTPSPAYTPQTVPVNLVWNSSTNYAEGEIILTNTSRKHSYLELVCDAGTYSGGTFNPLINGIRLTVKMHATAPPVDGTEVMLAFYRVVNGSTDVTTSWASVNKPIDLLPNTDVAIQDNTPGALVTPIRFQSVSLKSNITFAKNTFSSQVRLIVVAEKNMI